MKCNFRIDSALQLFSTFISIYKSHLEKLKYVLYLLKESKTPFIKSQIAGGSDCHFFLCLYREIMTISPVISHYYLVHICQICMFVMRGLAGVGRRCCAAAQRTNWWRQRECKRRTATWTRWILCLRRLAVLNNSWLNFMLGCASDQWA